MEASVLSETNRTQIREQLLARQRELSEVAQAESRAVAAALHRLDEGHYGVCETCGAKIDAKRLAAVPCTDQCQSCAAQANS